MTVLARSSSNVTDRPIMKTKASEHFHSDTHVSDDSSLNFEGGFTPASNFYADELQTSKGCTETLGHRQQLRHKFRFIRQDSYGLRVGRGRGSIPARGTGYFSTPQRADRLWAHPASYPIGIGGDFLGGKVAEA
jgi:hypothetical protein